MLYRVLMRLIMNKQTDGLEEKLNVFFAANKLTQAQYLELSELVSAANN